MDMSININVDDNTSVSKMMFPAGLVIGKNCEFTNCEFKKDCMFKTKTVNSQIVNLI